MEAMEAAWGSQETSRKILFPKGHGSLRGLGHVPPVTIAVSIEAWWSFSKPAMENGTEEDCCMTTTFLSSCVPK